MLKTVLRSPPFLWSFRWLHPDVGSWIAGHASKTGKRWQGPSERDIARSDVLTAWALEELERRSDLDLFLMGHTHIPRMDRASTGAWYVNSGDWVWHRSYVVLREGEEPELRTLRGSGAT